MSNERRADRRDVVVRRYAARTYEEDLDSMADAGWYPVATVWGWDSVGSAGVLFGGSSWKPGDGTLAVTYRPDPRGGPA